MNLTQIIAMAAIQDPELARLAYNRLREDMMIAVGKEAGFSPAVISKAVAMHRTTLGVEASLSLQTKGRATK